MSVRLPLQFPVQETSPVPKQKLSRSKPVSSANVIYSSLLLPSLTMALRKNRRSQLNPAENYWFPVLITLFPAAIISMSVRLPLPSPEKAAIPVHRRKTSLSLQLILPKPRFLFLLLPSSMTVQKRNQRSL